MFRIIRALINIVVTIIEVLLVFRFILTGLAANPATPFVAWLYGITAPLVAPFVKILPDWKFSGFVVHFTTLVALIAYAVAGYVLLMIFPHSHEEPGDV